MRYKVSFEFKTIDFGKFEEEKVGSMGYAGGMKDEDFVQVSREIQNIRKSYKRQQSLDPKLRQHQFIKIEPAIHHSNHIHTDQSHNEDSNEKKIKVFKFTSTPPKKEQRDRLYSADDKLLVSKDIQKPGVAPKTNIDFKQLFAALGPEPIQEVDSNKSERSTQLQKDFLKTEIQNLLTPSDKSSPLSPQLAILTMSKQVSQVSNFIPDPNAKSSKPFLKRKQSQTLNILVLGAPRVGKTSLVTSLKFLLKYSEDLTSRGSIISKKKEHPPNIEIKGSSPKSDKLYESSQIRLGKHQITFYDFKSTLIPEVKELIYELNEKQLQADLSEYKARDVRLHLILYVIHSLKKTDIALIDSVKHLLPTIPVIARADTFEQVKLNHIKAKVSFQQGLTMNTNPYSLVLPDTEIKRRVLRNGTVESRFGREYAWGFCNAFDEKVSDLKRLYSDVFEGEDYAAKSQIGFMEWMRVYLARQEEIKRGRSKGQNSQMWKLATLGMATLGGAIFMSSRHAPPSNI